MNVVAFDIEIAEPFDEEPKRYGISCASTLTSDGELFLWHGDAGLFGYDENYPNPDRMNPYEVSELAQYLLKMQESGYNIVTWNGLSFDFKVLAEEVEDEEWADEIQRMAINSIDPGFQMACEKGYMIGLNAAAEGLGVGGKTEGMHGDLAPLLWNGLNGNETEEQVNGIKSLNVVPATKEAQDLCLEYVGQDSQITLDIYLKLVEQGFMYWLTKRGTISFYPYRPSFYSNGNIISPCETIIGTGKWKKSIVTNDEYKSLLETNQERRLLKVHECFDLPQPDTGWMDRKPKERTEFLDWIDERNKKW